MILIYPLVAGVIFTFSPTATLQAPLLISGSGDQLSLCIFYYWCLIGSFYSIKSMILTYLMVTGFSSSFPPFSPLQALPPPKGCGDPLLFFGQPHWYLFSFYLWILRMLTYPLLQVLFPHFCPFRPCWPQSSLMGEGDPLALFRHCYWHLICLFYRCKSTILTYLMVIGFVSTFSPLSPSVGYTPQPMGVSMITLWTSLQVSIEFIMSLQI